MPRIIFTALLISLFGFGAVGTADAYRGCPKLQAPHSDWITHAKFCRPIKAPKPGIWCCSGAFCTKECVCCHP
jgi:hypothetical protein